MPTFTGTQSTASGPDLEDGYYDSKIRETETVEGKWGPQVQVQFECIDEVDRDGNPVEFRGWFTIPTDKQGNVQPVRVGKPLGNLFSAALFAGEPYPEGTSLDTDDLIGRIVRVNWGEYTNRDGVKKVGVIAVKASKKNKTPAATGAKAGTLRKRLVDDDDDDDDLDDA